MTKPVQARQINVSFMAANSRSTVWPGQQYVTVESGVSFVVFPAIPSGWRVQTVAKEVGKFGAIKDLPSSWAGLNGDALAEASGVADATFCHNGRFICGAQSKEGALAMAKKAMEA